jgi:hypothetical protein
MVCCAANESSAAQYSFSKLIWGMAGSDNSPLSKVSTQRVQLPSNIHLGSPRTDSSHILTCMHMIADTTGQDMENIG